MSELIERQAALNALMDAVKSVGVLDADDIKTVFDMLPSVQQEKAQLSKEGTTSDLISKTETVEHLRRMLEATVPNTDYDEGYIDGIEFGISTVSTMPTIQPEPQWIPVSERLPEDLSEVNVTWVNHNPEPYYEFTKDKPFTATAVYYKGNWYWYSATCVDYLGEYGRCDWNKIDEAIEIIAWMPLPKPYEGESEQE